MGERFACGQLMLQAPGPRGSPHIPQGVGDALASKGAADAPFDETAKTESCFSSESLAQAGQCGLCPWRVKYSK